MSSMTILGIVCGSQIKRKFVLRIRNAEIM